MKLIYCPYCGDIFRLREELKRCTCGFSGGKYIDSLAAIVTEESICLGFTNNSFTIALNNIPESGLGKTFNAFVIPKNVSSITRVKILEE